MSDESELFEEDESNRNKRQKREEGRKIPGPAGALLIGPDSKLKNEGDVNLLGGKLIKNRMMYGPSSNNHSSRSSNDSPIDDDFRKGPWLSMLHHFVCHPFQDEKRHRMHNNIQRILQGDFMDHRSKFLVVLLKKITPTDTDSHVELKDPSGEIEGTMHRSVVEQHPGINTGTVLAIKHFAILSTRPNKHYINITPANISRVFPTKSKSPNDWNDKIKFDPISIYDPSLIRLQCGEGRLNEVLNSIQSHRINEETVELLEDDEENQMRLQQIIVQENQQEEELE